MISLLLLSISFVHAAYFIPPQPFVEWTKSDPGKDGGSQYVMNDFGVRLEDVNGDGLVDFVIGLYDSADVPQSTIYKTYLNNGCEWVDASGQMTFSYCHINGTSLLAPIRSRLQSLQYLNSAEVALMIGVAEKHVQVAIEGGELVARKVGSDWLILKSAVDKWLGTK